MFSFAGQPQYPNFNNVMPGYNMVHPTMMGMNIQPNMMNMGMNPILPNNPNNPSINHMNLQQNRGIDQNFQINANPNMNNDPFNFRGR
jgi:hypothetical protein